jgi:hypothetical protein
MSYQVWPYAQLSDGEWSIPEDILAYTWSELYEHGKVEKVFWAGGVRSFSEFVKFLRLPENHPLFLVEETGGLPVAICWLNGVEGNHALAHFCVLGPFEVSMGHKVLEYWGSFKNGNGRKVVEVLLGFIPETNIPAIKTVQKIGFKVLGTIPKLCDLPFEHRQVGGTVVYYDWGGK